MSLCAKGKVAHESHARNACCEDNKKVVGENFLLAQNEGRCRTLHLHV
jgi:hypothetical protein